VAVLDVMMTRPDEGFDLARTLRKDARTAGIPLLMLTSVNAANSERGLLFRLSDRDRDDMWLPVDRFVDKPVAPEKLLGLVRELAH
jgi:CheY-like chemotaxis protein